MTHKVLRNVHFNPKKIFLIFFIGVPENCAVPVVPHSPLMINMPLSKLVERIRQSDNSENKIKDVGEVLKQMEFKSQTLWKVMFVMTQ